MILRLTNFFKPISISLSPNTEHDDVRLAAKLLLCPWRWRGNAKSKETSEKILEKEFARRLEVPYTFAFNSGRSALLAILNSLHLQKGDEVLLQAFTCNALPNPVLWAGLKPVYVDCNEDDFNINVQDVERKVTPRSKAVIVQHTFGLPADMDKIMEICKKHNLILLEDCAHALGARYKGKQVGTFGKAAFFSFSRDKVISSVYGGMAVTNDDGLAKKIGLYQERVGYPSFFWIFQQLLHPPLMNWIILPSYGVLGKYLLVVFQWLHILSKAVHWKEKRGMKPDYFPQRMPNALALFALHQLRKLERFNGHRKHIASLYGQKLSSVASFQIPNVALQTSSSNAVFLRFPVQHSKAHGIIQKAWAQNLLIGDWYTSPVAPEDTRLETMHYQKGTCPTAERLAQTTFNLPTHIKIKEKEVAALVQFLKSFAM